jgi:hypothetical protein
MRTTRLLIGIACIGCVAATTGATAQEGTNARMERHLQRNTYGARHTVVGAQRVPDYRGMRVVDGYAYRGQPLYAYAPNYSYQAPSYGYTYDPGYAYSYAPGYTATVPSGPYDASGYNDYAPGVSIGIGPVGIGVGPTWGW